jgi:nucleotide-binding universal stress UspA family protein
MEQRVVRDIIDDSTVIRSNQAKDEGIPDVKTEIFIDAKSITESIIEYATRKNIDLIVIGTRGRAGLKRFFMGSIANGVVQHAHCSVLLVG